MPGSPPVNISISSYSSTTLTISWGEPTQPNGIITDYNLTCMDDTDHQHSIMTTGDITTVTVNSLLPYTNYTCTVIPYTKVGPGPGANVAGITDEDSELMKY